MKCDTSANNNSMSRESRITTLSDQDVTYAGYNNVLPDSRNTVPIISSALRRIEFSRISNSTRCTRQLASRQSVARGRELSGWRASRDPRRTRDTALVRAAPDRSILPAAVGVKFLFATRYPLPRSTHYPLRGVGLVPPAVVQGDSQPLRGGYMLPLITVSVFNM